MTRRRLGDGKKRRWHTRAAVRRRGAGRSARRTISARHPRAGETRGQNGESKRGQNITLTPGTHSTKVTLSRVPPATQHHAAVPTDNKSHCRCTYQNPRRPSQSEVGALRVSNHSESRESRRRVRRRGRILLDLPAAVRLTRRSVRVRHHLLDRLRLHAIHVVADRGLAHHRRRRRHRRDGIRCIFFGEQSPNRGAHRVPCIRRGLRGGLRRGLEHPVVHVLHLLLNVGHRARFLGRRVGVGRRVVGIPGLWLWHGFLHLGRGGDRGGGDGGGDADALVECEDVGAGFARQPRGLLLDALSPDSVHVVLHHREARAGAVVPDECLHRGGDGVDIGALPQGEDPLPRR
mmetsp:Transcript_10637/g.48861  ORF Transcript_10637/g.48861 Transcript_10637/m.48861 type:complete len:347 (+) Transcript_10637:3410-4450(+)